MRGKRAIGCTTCSTPTRRHSHRCFGWTRHSSTRSDYLATYPKLAAFIAQHPEVPHKVFFVGDSGYRVAVVDNRLRAVNAMEGVLAAIAGLIVFSTIVVFLTWVIRSVINYWRIEAVSPFTCRTRGSSDVSSTMLMRAGRISRR